LESSGTSFFGMADRLSSRTASEPIRDPSFLVSGGPGSRFARPARHGANSRRDHDLADDGAVLDQAQPFARLLERQHLVDHRLHSAAADQLHQPLEIVVVEAVRADDLELEAPHVAQILFWIVAGGGAADEQLAASLEAAQRWHPGVAAGEIDHHVDAALVAPALRLAVFVDRPFRPVDL